MSLVQRFLKLREPFKRGTTVHIRNTWQQVLSFECQTTAWQFTGEHMDNLLGLRIFHRKNDAKQIKEINTPIITVITITRFDASNKITMSTYNMYIYQMMLVSCSIIVVTNMGHTKFLSHSLKVSYMARFSVSRLLNKNIDLEKHHCNLYNLSSPPHNMLQHSYT